jgi:hypothetical protein
MQVGNTYGNHQRGKLGERTMLLAALKVRTSAGSAAGYSVEA